MEQTHNVYINKEQIGTDKEEWEAVFEIVAGQHYGVRSRSQSGVFRNIKVTVGTDDVLILECDCEAGYFRGPHYMCHHKKIAMPVIASWYADQAEKEEIDETDIAIENMFLTE